MTSIEKYIEDKVVISSGEVLRYIEKTFGVSNDAARKRLQRLHSYIYKIKGICRDGQSILYHEKNWTNPNFLDKLLIILKDNTQQHYAVLNAIKLYCGLIPKKILAEYTISPIGNIKGHKRLSAIITDLTRLRLISEIDDSYVALGGYITCNDKRSKAFNVIHEMTIAHFHEWGRNIGLFAYHSAKFHHDLNSYQFAMVAPSYINSLVAKSTKGKAIPAFVVVDILLNKDLGKDDIVFFIKKLENVSMRTPNAKIIPFLLIGAHDKEVYQLLKEKGIIVGNVDELFGNKYLETVYGIQNLIENAGAILKSYPEQYLNVIKSIEALSTGKTYNLKGDLFEMAVGYFHGQLCKILEISKTIRHDNEIREIDVYAVYQDKVVFAECKGYNSKIDVDYVEEWLSKKIPIIRKWALSCESLCDKKIVFEIWSTGGFTAEANEELSRAQQGTKKYQIDVYDLDKMRLIAKEKKVRHFVKIVDSYYTKEILYTNAK